jgi:hypothetical protein
MSKYLYFRMVGSSYVDLSVLAKIMGVLAKGGHGWKGNFICNSYIKGKRENLVF